MSELISVDIYDDLKQEYAELVEALDSAVWLLNKMAKGGGVDTGQYDSTLKSIRAILEKVK